MFNQNLNQQQQPDLQRQQNSHPNPPGLAGLYRARPSECDTEFSDELIKYGFVSDDPTKNNIALLGWDTIVERVRNDNSSDKTTTDIVQNSRLSDYFFAGTNSHIDQDIVAGLTILAKSFRKKLYEHVKARLRAGVYSKFNRVCDQVRNILRNQTNIPYWLLRPQFKWTSFLKLLRQSVIKLQQAERFTDSLPELKLLCSVLIDTLQSTTNRGPQLVSIAVATKDYFQYDDSRPGSVQRPNKGKSFTTKLVSMNAQDTRNKALTAIGLTTVSPVRGTLSLKSLPGGIHLHFSTCKEWNKNPDEYVQEYLQETRHVAPSNFYPMANQASLPPINHGAARDPVYANEDNGEFSALSSSLEILNDSQSNFLCALKETTTHVETMRLAMSIMVSFSAIGSSLEINES